MTVDQLHSRLASLINTGSGNEIVLVWSESLGNYEQVTKIVEMDDGGFSIS